MSWVLYFQDQTTNVCTFLLINGSLNEDKEPNLTTNHISPRAKRFANYALKTGMEEVASQRRQKVLYSILINAVTNDDRLLGLSQYIGVVS
jgi:hypothetical protein